MRNPDQLRLSPVAPPAQSANAQPDSILMDETSVSGQRYDSIRHRLERGSCSSEAPLLLMGVVLGATFVTSVMTYAPAHYQQIGRFD